MTAAAAAVKRVRVRRRVRHHHLNLPNILAQACLVLAFSMPVAILSMRLAEINETDWIIFNSGLTPDRVTVEPMPTGCGLCRYKPQLRPKDKAGQQFVIEWTRVDDD